jgi:hypothetical protein
VITESDAQELHHCIGAALAGDLSGLIRAQQIAHELLTEVLPAWRWEATAAGVTALAGPTAETSEPVVDLAAALVAVVEPEVVEAAVA